MNTVKASNFQTSFRNRLAIKLGLWFLLSLALSVVFLRDFWSSLPDMLSPAWVFGQHHASPWGVLVLCFIFLWLKRKEVWSQMSRGLSPAYVLLGLGMVAVAVLPEFPQEFLVFQVLLASVGLFAIIFGSGSQIPTVCLTIYTFAISFPLLVERYAEGAYSQSVITPLTGLMTAFGYPLQNQGQLVQFTSFSGEPILVTITAACAGPATMGVFLAIFALMMLDRPLSARKAAWLLPFGVVGTWFQSFIRLVFLLLVGYYMGERALWTAHFWTIYILFPLWYLFFAYIYFRQVRRPVEAEQGIKRIPIPNTVR